jgi:predicted dehydrogenase
MPLSRRRFLATTALAFPALLLAQKPGRLVRVAIVGTSGRGTDHAMALAKLADVEIAYVCDVDEKKAGSAAAAVEKRTGKAPKIVRDFREILGEKELDAITVATPDHWHTPAALLALSAGKHVYVEKPCSHNAREGELLVEAARKHDRRVQHGTQRRSWPAIQEAMARLRAGELGRVRSVRAYYFNSRPSIGQGKPAAVPAGLDWSLWQGPAPEREFHDNYVHYHWHWFWQWGTGELGNNGVHMLDLCRWGAGVEFPSRITSAGEKLGFPKDDQETPDTNTVTYDCGGSTITWECRSWANRTPNDPKHDVAFFCEKGSLLINGDGYTIHDLKGVETFKGSGASGDAGHFQNFIDAIRGDAKLNAEIGEGHKTTLLCHLGNIAWRTGKTLHFDPKTKSILDDPEAGKLWAREYRAGWEPKV